MGKQPITPLPLSACRRLIREKLDQLHAQLATYSPATTGGGGGARKSDVKGKGKGEEGTTATLRLLTGVARFHRWVRVSKPLLQTCGVNHSCFNGDDLLQ